MQMARTLGAVPTHLTRINIITSHSQDFVMVGGSMQQNNNIGGYNT